MSEKPEALWTVDRRSNQTGELTMRFVFRTRQAARAFVKAHADNKKSRYLEPVRARFGPEQ